MALSSDDGVQKALEKLMEKMEESEKRAQIRHEQMLTSLSSMIANLLGNKVNDDPEKEDDDHQGEVGTAEEKAKVDQRDIQFDENDIYGTLVDPFVREKKELEEFAIKASELYTSGEYTDVVEMSYTDFLHWTEDHFRSLPGKVLQGIRDCLIDNGAAIQKAPGLRISKALVDYRDDALSSYQRNVERPAEKPPDESPGEVLIEEVEKERMNKLVSTDNNKRGDIDNIVEEHDEEEERRVYDNSSRSRSRPSDISKIFSRDMKYSGGPKEPLRRRFELFKDACLLCGVDTTDVELMMRIIPTTFLSGQATMYFTDVIRQDAKSTDEAITLLEEHFLDQRAKRVNDEIWHDLSFDFVKQKRSYEKSSTTFESCLDDLLRQIAELADIRTGPGSEAAIMAKTISAVRDIETFTPVCRNPPESLRALNSALRSSALEADRALIRGSNASSSYKANANSLDAVKTMEDFLSYYVDRQLKAQEVDRHDSRRKFKGYGRASNVRWKERRRVPTNVCIVCHKTGCHSSKHKDFRKRLPQIYAAMAGSPSEDSDEGETTESDVENDDSASAYISAARAIAAVGMSTKDANWLVDSATIDTGSSILSTVGNQLTTAVRVASARPTKVETTEGNRSIEGLGATVTTIGTLKFYFYFGGRLYNVKIFIVPGCSPFLLSHRDMDRMGLNYSTLHKLIDRPEDGYSEHVEMRNNLPHLVFNSPGYFTDSQLRTMHRNLGHPSIDKQMKIIKSADIAELPENTRKQLTNLVKNCHPCQMTKKKPRRFLFSIKEDCTGEFNHILQVDVVKLVDGNVLHVICMGTGFQGGKFLNKMTADAAWSVLRRCWIDIYAGAPDFIEADAGTNFTAEEFRNKASAMGTIVKICPVEAHDRVGRVERKHAILRSVYTKLKMDLPGVRREEILSLAFRAINDVPSSTSGISPTTLVFGVYPKIPGAGPRGTIAERANIVRQCTQMVIRQNARRTVRESVRERNTPSVAEIEKVRTIPPGSDVRVYRENVGWKIYPLVRVHESDVDVTLPSGKISTFPINMVRPYFKERDGNGHMTHRKSSTSRTASVPFQIVTRSQAIAQGQKNATKGYASLSKSAEFYRSSRLEEINGLHEQGCFEVVDKTESDGHRLYRPVFVDKVKPDGSKRSRLCAAACNDQDHGLFTAAPTVKRMSLRLLAAMSSSLKLDMFSRDVTKAFIMSRTKLRRPVFMKAPAEMKLDKTSVLKILLPLYGMPESPMHWFKTYLDYHRNGLEMEQIPIDHCLLYSRDGDTTTGLLALQVDDTLFAGRPEFLRKEMSKSTEFPNKGRTAVLNEKVRFNGIDIRKVPDGYVLDQAAYIDEIPNTPAREIMSFDKFRSIRAQYAYAAFSTAPDVLVYVANLAQVTESRYDEDKTAAMKIMRKLQKTMTKSPAITGIKYISIPTNVMEVVVCIDAAFAVNSDHTSQLGIVSMLRNKTNGETNVIHYLSVKSKRVCKSVLAAELFAMVDGLDIGYCLKDSVKRITGRDDVELTIYTDSRTLYGLCISLSQTTERRLQIDLAILREAYERRDVNHVLWISGDANPADDLTKVEKRCGALTKVLKTNAFNPDLNSWIMRDERPIRTERLPTTSQSTTLPKKKI